MTVVHVTPHLPPDQAANAILPALAGQWSRARGVNVRYVAHPPAQGGAPTTPEAGPVEWVGRRDRGRSVLRLLRIDAWQRLRGVGTLLDRLAAKDTIDVLHLHSNGLLVEAAADWAIRRQVPYVLTLYGTEIWHYKRRRLIDLFTRAYRQASAVTFYSDRLKQRAIDLGLDRDHLSVVYPAVPAGFEPRDDATRQAWRAQLGIAEPFLVVNVKRLHELAGQTHLIDAFAQLRQMRQDVRLVICGTGALRESLEAQCARLGIAEAVTFTGLVSNEEVARYSGAADVFALPSLLEALPTVAVEALASGTPVVSADHPGGLELQHLFGDDVTVVPRRDATSLARGLMELLAARRRTRPGTATTLNRLFRPDAIAGQYATLYDSVVADTLRS